MTAVALRHHPVAVRGPSPGDARSAPVILQRTDDDFVGAVLDELAADPGLQQVLRSEARARDAAARLMLFQPVQRTFHLVLVQAECDVLGTPRLDPAKIESAGLVVRRCVRVSPGRAASPGRPAVPPTDDQNRLEGWRAAGEGLRGWVPFSGAAEQDLDPDPALRPASLRAGHPEIDRRLRDRAAPSSDRLVEEVSPLFIAPPEICRQTGRTLLYGLLPVTSHDLADAPGDLTYKRDDVRATVSPYLFSQVALSVSPRSARVGRDAPVSLEDDETFQDILSALQQVTFQFGAFGDTADGRGFLALLNRHRLVMPDGSRRLVGEWMRDAADVLLLQDPEAASVEMPREWPGYPRDTHDALLAHMQRAMQARVAQVRPQVGRFDEGGRLYRARALLRLRDERGCRHGPVWTAYTEPFTIAPWYEGSGRPPVRIELPDLSPALLKKLTPNVAVALSPKLFNLLNNLKLKGVLDGKKPSEKGTTIQWICSFNLLIIFMVAFMIMFIFLVMFDLFFSWLAFVKICIPIPKQESS